MKRNIIMSLSLLLLMATSVLAGQTDSLKLDQEKLFVGVRLGMPAAEADFSSFGADKFRPGWGVGANVGYRFTDVWSLDMTATWGQLFLTEQDCCNERHYFLGNDLNRYLTELIPEGMDGQMYSDLQSNVFTQRYGLQANMNILGFFEQSRRGPWRLELAPAVYAVGTSADILAKSDKLYLAQNINEWHLGYGGQLQATYAVAENLNLGLYGGFTHLAGNQLDGMPKLHSTNYIMDAGVKFTISLTKAKRPAAQPATPSVVPSAPVVAPVKPIATPVAPATESVADSAESTEQPQSAVPVTSVVPVTSTVPETNVVPVTSTVPTEETTPVVSETPAPVVAKVDEPKVEEPKAEETKVQRYTFPVIYFSFNSIWIEPSERAKVKEIADMMKKDKTIRVRVTGWCDPVGSVDANKRVSLQRAEAVKRVLGQWLVPADRIETVGGGVNHDAATEAEARNATTIEIF